MLIACVALTAQILLWQQAVKLTSLTIRRRRGKVNVTTVFLKYASTSIAYFLWFFKIVGVTQVLIEFYTAVGSYKQLV
jgi:hypothetical protein